MRKITSSQLYTLMNSNPISIIDIRDQYKFLKGHIPTSINIPYKYIVTKPNEYLSKNITYFLICDYGITSEEAANKLQHLGYDVVSVVKGISSWSYGLVI